MLSLEMRLWQNPGAVSCALIKHSGAFVAPSSLLFSQKLKERAAAKLQQSCQLDRNSPYISVTRQRGALFLTRQRLGGCRTLPVLASVPIEDPWFQIFSRVVLSVVHLPECSCKDRRAQLANHLQLGWKKDKIRFRAMQLVADSSQAHNQLALFSLLILPLLLPPPPFRAKVNIQNT